MSFVAAIILALFSVISIACAIGTLFPSIMANAHSILSKPPSTFSKYRKISFQFYVWAAFMIFAFIGWNIIFYNGIIGSLWFIEDHYGATEHWKKYIAGLLAFLFSVILSLRLEQISKTCG